jgi:diguanylate cyclase (GGDEF)-like protein
MIRSMIYSAVLIAVLVDMFLFLAAQLENSAKLVKLLFLTLIGGYIAATLVRVTLVVVQGILDQIDFYETSVTSFILIVSIVFSILWFTVIQLFASESIQDVLSAKEAEITKLVQTDQLTGLWNRSYFEEELSALIEKAIEEEHQLSLIHLDIDHFKDLNERFGHAIGDQVLKEVVAIIRQTLSAKTPLIRWGGQEIMILSYTTAEESVKKAEVLRHNIANNNFTHFESVTASFGVAGYRENEAIDLWFKRVEMALREAKQSGRNCGIKGPK